MDIDLGRGAAYGKHPHGPITTSQVEVQPVEIQVDLDTESFQAVFGFAGRAYAPKN